MIEIIDIYKTLGGMPILKGISLHIRKNKIRVILGLSGSGKSVLMRHIIGLMQPDSGQIIVEGKHIEHASSQEMLALRHTFGMVFQQSALFDSMTVAENVAFPLIEHVRLRKKEVHERVMHELERVQLQDAAHKYPNELSGGMKKRVALARAVILKPRCLLYDEPTTGLDPITTDHVDHMIADASRDLDVTSVVISHDIGSALKIADDIAVIHEGRIIEDCPKEHIKNSSHPFVQLFLQSWFQKQ